MMLGESLSVYNILYRFHKAIDQLLLQITVYLYYNIIIWHVEENNIMHIDCVVIEIQF